jgi:hypothetical protein
MLHWVGVDERARRWALGAFAALVIVALVGLVWKVRQGQRAPSAASARTAASGQGGDADDDPGAGQGGRGGDPAPELPGGESDPPEAPPNIPVPQLGDIVGEAGRLVKAAARSCGRGSVGAAQLSQRVLVRYTLLVEDGRARVVEPFLVDNTISDQVIVQCLTTEIARIEYDVPAAPTSRKKLQEVIRMIDVVGEQ